MSAFTATVENVATGWIHTGEPVPRARDAAGRGAQSLYDNVARFTRAEMQDAFRALLRDGVVEHGGYRVTVRKV